MPIPTINVARRRAHDFLVQERARGGLQGAHWPGARTSSGDRKAFLRQPARRAYAAKSAATRRACPHPRGIEGIRLELRLGEIARIWKGGCIIRAKLLETVRAAFHDRADLPNLLVDARFAELINHLGPSLRWVVSRATEHGLPCLGMCASLAYIDAYRSARLPANLIQAQRDYFGSHRYERIDKPRGQSFHTARSGWLAH